MGVGDPSKDQELMTVICDVLSNYDPTTQEPRKTKKAGNKALLKGSKPVGVQAAQTGKTAGLMTTIKEETKEEGSLFPTLKSKTPRAVAPES